ncbi:MAG: cytochrome c [Kofleriaceae bacterium]|nr:cytochrome c [Kofleriaceae bacterium]
MTARAVPLVRTRCWLALGFALAVAACLPAPEPPIDHGSFEDVRRIVAALDDVAGEYHLAVGPDGRELDPVRRRILRALMHDAQVFAQRFGAGERDALATIAAAVDAGAAPAGVEDAARRLRAGMLARRRLVLAPGDAIGRGRAEALWHTHCAGCHGPTGVGDGAQGLYLEPEPKNFHEPEVMAGMTASRAQSRIADGMRETAMPSWGLLSTTERWALAFLIMAFQHDEAAVARGRAVAARRGLALSLPWQADRSDGALVAELVARGLAADEAADVVAFARAEAAFAPTGGRLAGARRQLDVARRAYRERRFAAAAAELGRVRLRDDLDAVRIGARAPPPASRSSSSGSGPRSRPARSRRSWTARRCRDPRPPRRRRARAVRAHRGWRRAPRLERGALAALALGLLLGAARRGRRRARRARPGCGPPPRRRQRGHVAARRRGWPLARRRGHVAGRRRARARGRGRPLVARGRGQPALRVAAASATVGAARSAPSPPPRRRSGSRRPRPPSPPRSAPPPSRADAGARGGAAGRGRPDWRRRWPRRPRRVAGRARRPPSTPRCSGCRAANRSASHPSAAATAAAAAAVALGALALFAATCRRLAPRAAPVASSTRSGSSSSKYIGS